MRYASIYLSLLVFILTGTVSTLEAQDAAASRLVIGVRSQARPFSYKLAPKTIDSDATRGPLGRAGYGGYMIRICDAVLSEMLVDRASEALELTDITIYDIDDEEEKSDARSREPSDAGAKENSPRPSRFDHLGTKFDILCDPATIINSRRDFIVSPPLFLTGISYITRKNAAPPTDPCGDPDPPITSPAGTGASGSTTTEANGNSPPKDRTAAAGANSTSRPALIGLVGGTTAGGSGLSAFLAAREMPKYEQHLVTYLRKNGDGKDETTENKNPGPGECAKGRLLVKTYPTHEAAAQKFCIDQAFHYYVGDLEIIRSYVEAIPGCKFDNGVITYTNDRYAIFGKAIGEGSTASSEAQEFSQTNGTPKNPASDERRLLVARFFEILAQKVVFNPSVLDKAYDDTFPNQPQSRKLKLFYWAIRGERQAEVWQPPLKDSAKDAAAKDGAVVQSGK